MRNQLLGLIALMLKRGWLEETAEGRALIFEQATQMVAAPDVSLQSLAANLLLNLTDEFSFTRQSSLGLSWEYHIKSRCLFQAAELQRTFSIASTALSRHAALAAALSAEGGYGSAQFVAWAEGWLGVLAAVLGWDFSQSSESESVLKGMSS
eukprot:SAG11_NODE_13940_length_632_cov_1.058161_2_plen_151_part_01